MSFSFSSTPLEISLTITKLLDLSVFIVKATNFHEMFYLLIDANLVSRFLMYFQNDLVPSEKIYLFNVTSLLCLW